MKPPRMTFMKFCVGALIGPPPPNMLRTRPPTISRSGAKTTSFQKGVSMPSCRYFNREAKACSKILRSSDPRGARLASIVFL
ncbi:hypothetical protein ABL78_8299 [Leptomonas seymouri]|uniref:Uncharacterized protein n=1 Tax=Leptomonas seymouri TaxID=5684 RepID=A0A0N1HSV7_LEPSE|nr:hypothetical protein ABL78_8299 [Leptomonas seymouri]|eukprot:KPI82690.1 hypothetical protein ABL78_8299 [Leptomonas seymouri]